MTRPPAVGLDDGGPVGAACGAFNGRCLTRRISLNGLPNQPAVWFLLMSLMSSLGGVQQLLGGLIVEFRQVV